MIGRSHGVHAEPITFGIKLASYYAEFQRNLKRIENAKDEISICSISGPVGQILLMTNKEKKFRNIIFISLVVNVCLNIILIPLFGVVGAAYSTIISISILLPIYICAEYLNL